MNEQFLEWVGHIASAIILISLLMNSIVKLRWINLIGAVVFSFYGFALELWPVAIMNVGIVFIDVYYLAKMYLSDDYFTILAIDDNSQYFQSFIDFYREDIESFSPLNELNQDDATVKLYILRNMEIAGVFVGKKETDDTLSIELDYAIPRYRDFKLGHYLFDTKKEYFKELGIRKFTAISTNEAHTKYLKKMGFIEEKYGFVKAI